MKVLEIQEQENGSAICIMEMSDEEKNFLIEFGFNEMLKNSLEMFEEDLLPKDILENEGRLCSNCDAVIDLDTIKTLPHTELCADCIN